MKIGLGGTTTRKAHWKRRQSTAADWSFLFLFFILYPIIWNLNIQPTEQRHSFHFVWMVPTISSFLQFTLARIWFSSKSGQQVVNPGMDLGADSQSSFPRISPKGLRLEMGSLVKEKDLNALKLPSSGHINSYTWLPHFQVLGEYKPFLMCCVRFTYDQSNICIFVLYSIYMSLIINILIMDTWQCGLFKAKENGSVGVF